MFLAYSVFGTMLEYRPVGEFGLWPPGLNALCMFHFFAASGIWSGLLMAVASRLPLTAGSHYFLAGFYAVFGTACLGLVTAGILIKMPPVVSGTGLSAAGGEFVSGAVVTSRTMNVSVLYAL